MHTAQTISNNISSGVVAKKEAEILEAVSLVTNPALLDPKRLSCLVVGGVETFCLDGVQFVRFWPVEYRTERTEDGWKIVATQSFQRL